MDDLLTFAEIEYLVGDEPGWPRVRQLMGWSEPDCAPDVRAAGLAGLMSKGLVAIEPNGEVRARSGLVELVGRLPRAHDLAAVLAESDGGLSSAVVLRTDDLKPLVVAFAGPGVVELRAPADPEASASVLMDVADGLLAVDRSSVAVRTLLGEPAGLDLVAVRDGDALVVSSSGSSGERQVMTRAGGLEVLHRRLRMPARTS